MNTVRAWKAWKPKEHNQNSSDYLNGAKCGRNIYVDDMQRFLTSTSHAIHPSNWNLKIEKCVNQYMFLLQKSTKLNQDGQLCVFETKFFETLRKGNFDKAKISTKDVDILQCVRVIIPIEDENRYSLAVIDPVRREIIHYNEFYDARIFSLLSEYIVFDCQKRHNVDFNMIDWVYTNERPNIEKNDSSVFVCAFAESLARNQCNFKFIQDHMEYFRMRVGYEIGTNEIMEQKLA